MTSDRPSHHRKRSSSSPAILVDVKHSYEFTGNSAAHEALEHTVRAVQAFVEMLNGQWPDDARSKSMHHLDQALLWLPTATMSDLDRTTRWMAVQRLDIYHEMIELWMFTHRDETGGFVSWAHDADHALADVVADLYGPDDHRKRLIENGLIARRDVRRFLYEDEEWGEGSPPEGEGPPSRETLTAFVTQLQAIVTTASVAD